MRSYRFTILLTALLVIGSSARAQLDNKQWESFDRSNVRDNPSVQFATQNVADPVQVSNGEVRIRKVDLTVPSVGFSFSFVRTYRSGTSYDGPIGKGWSHNFNMRIEYDGTGNKMLCWDGSNREDVFTWDATSEAWDPSAGRYDHIVDSGGATSPGATIHRITANGFKYVYERCTDDLTKYRLKEMKDRNSNTLSLTYAGTETIHRLTSITDTNGRSYSITYDGNKRIQKLSDFGSPAREIKYTYSSGNLTEVEELTGESGLARKTTYTYDGTSSRVETITDGKENGKTSGTPIPFCRNYYDTSGRCIAQEYGPDAATGSGSAPTSNAYLFSYTGSGMNGVTQTNFTDRGGREFKFEFNSDGMATKRCFLDSGSSVAFEECYSYDANFNLTKVIKDELNEVRYAYATGPDRYAEGNLLSVKTTASGGSSALETAYTYESTYNLIATVTDPGGMKTSFTYDANGNLTSSIVDSDSGGQALTTTYTYDSSNNYLLDEVTDPRGTKTTYHYDASNYLTKTIADDVTSGIQLTVAKFGYDQFGNVTTSEDGLGNATTNTVNRLNQVTKITAPSPLSYETLFEYDKSDNVTRIDVQNVQGVSDFFRTTLSYDILDNLTSSTEEIDSTVSRTTTYAYDIDDLLTLVTDGEGDKTKYLYDHYHRNTEVVLGEGEAYEASFKYYYDGNFRLTKVREPKGANYETTYEFDHHDRTTKVIDPLGHFTVSSYTDHLLTSVAFVEGGGSVSTPQTKTEYEYDSANRLTKSRQLFKSSPGGTNVGDGWIDTVYRYDDGGLITETDDDSSNTVTSTYDAVGRLSIVEDPIGNKVEYEYDGASNMVTMTETEVEDSPGSSSDTYEHVYNYDNLNRKTEYKDPAAKTSKIVYDARGRVKETEDPNNFKTLIEYDELSRRTKLKTERAAATYIETRWEYDKVGRMTKAYDGENNATNYHYDALSRQTQVVFADTWDIDYEYDLNSNLTKKTDQNATITEYRYDRLNRMTEKDLTVTASHINGETAGQTYDFDALGRLTEAEDTDSRVKYTYNTASLVKTEEMQYGATDKAANSGKEVAWTYDAQGLVSGVLYPGSSAADGELRYHYDDANRLTQIRRTASSTEQDLVLWKYRGGRVIRKQYGNDTYCTVSYDSRKLVTGIDHKRETTPSDESIVEMAYHYDNAGSVTGEAIQHFNNSGTLLEDVGFVYAYDRAYRLTKVYREVPAAQVTSSAPSTYSEKIDYSLDNASNRQTVENAPLGGSKFDHIYTENSTNAYTSIDWAGTTETYQYDKAGNRTAVVGSLEDWRYDFENRIVALKVSGSEYGEYDYDALGRRIGKRFEHDGTKYLNEYRFYYAGSFLVQEYWVEEDEAEGESVTQAYEYVWGLGLQDPAWIGRWDVSTGSENGAGYYHCDESGTARALTSEDPSGAILESYRYFEYGAASVLSGDTLLAGAPWGNRLLWRGQYYDFEVASMASGIALYSSAGNGYDPETNSGSSRRATIGGFAGSRGANPGPSSTSPSNAANSGVSTLGGISGRNMPSGSSSSPIGGSGGQGRPKGSPQLWITVYFLRFYWRTYWKPWCALGWEVTSKSEKPVSLGGVHVFRRQLIEEIGMSLPFSAIVALVLGGQLPETVLSGARGGDNVQVGNWGDLKALVRDFALNKFGLRGAEFEMVTRLAYAKVKASYHVRGWKNTLGSKFNPVIGIAAASLHQYLNVFAHAAAVISWAGSRADSPVTIVDGVAENWGEILGVSAPGSLSVMIGNEYHKSTILKWGEAEGLLKSLLIAEGSPVYAVGFGLFGSRDMGGVDSAAFIEGFLTGAFFLQGLSESGLLGYSINGETNSYGLFLELNSNGALRFAAAFAGGSIPALSWSVLGQGGRIRGLPGSAPLLPGLY